MTGYGDSGRDRRPIFTAGVQALDIACGDGLIILIVISILIVWRSGADRGPPLFLPGRREDSAVQAPCTL
jgi:hypothetical protein